MSRASGVRALCTPCEAALGLLQRTALPCCCSAVPHPTHPVPLSCFCLCQSREPSEGLPASGPSPTQVPGSRPGHQGSPCSCHSSGLLSSLVFQPAWIHSMQAQQSESSEITYTKARKGRQGWVCLQTMAWGRSASPAAPARGQRTGEIREARGQLGGGTCVSAMSYLGEMSAAGWGV